MTHTNIYKLMLSFLFSALVTFGCSQNHVSLYSYSKMYVASNQGLEQVKGHDDQLFRTEYRVQIRQDNIITDIPGLEDMVLPVWNIQHNQIGSGACVSYSIDLLNGMTIFDVSNGQYVIFSFRNQGLYLLTNNSTSDAGNVFNKHFKTLLGPVRK